ncbi:MAG TPA: GNAT family N-acetyltransferase [Pirellulales bacterium]|nr:GNAT family N-acetyltransferase [Pirellulales bacterium]
MKLLVNDQACLTEIRPADKPAFVEHLAAKEIYDCTLRIPYPYTEADAEAWLQIVSKTADRHGQPVHWAIRNSAGELIGCCGFDGLEVDGAHRAEIGYWLAKPYWGRGIMSAVVPVACRWAFAEFGLAKITAWVFAFNNASSRVLEKCGFEQEGYLKRHFRKDGRLLDAKLYALFGDVSV